MMKRATAHYPQWKVNAGNARCRPFLWPIVAMNGGCWDLEVMAVRRLRRRSGQLDEKIASTLRIRRFMIMHGLSWNPQEGR